MTKKIEKYPFLENKINDQEEKSLDSEDNLNIKDTNIDSSNENEAKEFRQSLNIEPRQDYKVLKSLFQKRRDLLKHDKRSASPTRPHQDCIAVLNGAFQSLAT